MKVQVTGAVNRTGFVELTRTDASVYASIISAGGLRRTAGTELAVTRRSTAVADHGGRHPDAQSNPPAAHVSSATPEMPATTGSSLPDEPHAAAQRANSVDELAVSPTAPTIRPAVSGQSPAQNPGQNSGQGFYFVGDEPGAVPVAGAPAFVEIQNGAAPGSLRDAGVNGRGSVPAAGPHNPTTVWSDVTLARDREVLKSLQLSDGDSVTVKAATPPLRVGGIVNRPGAYPIPPGRILNVWQAIDLAGGLRDVSVPVNITLLRPAAEGRSAQRWFLSVPAYEKHPSASPGVEHGDVLHVEPTTGSKIKRAVGDLWNKP